MKPRRAKRSPGMALCILIILLVLLGCAQLGGPPPTPTLDSVVLTASSLETQNQGKTATAAAFGVQETARAAAELAPTQTAAAAGTATRAPAETAAAQARETSSAERTKVVLRVTDAAQKRKEERQLQQATQTAYVAGFQERLQTLYDEGKLSRLDGTYHRLDAFDNSWAQINWYTWEPTGILVEEFAIRADASWESASNSANWFNSGCGFVFADQDFLFAARDKTHHLVYLGLDGTVYLSRVRKGMDSFLGAGYYGSLDVPAGGAELLLTVQNDIVSFYVNKVQVLRKSDPSIAEGMLNLTLLSGTNKDYGTRCQMKNIDLWLFE